MKDSQDDGVINQARGLYDQMSAEARRKVERDRHEARRRGPLIRALWAVCVIAALLFAGVLIYGFTSFPDAPVRQTASGYAGKHGAPYTQAGYERFKLWEAFLIISFGLSVLAGVGAYISSEMSRQRDARTADRER
jgi:hypothetical protein